MFRRLKQENGVAMFNGNFRHPLDNLIRDDRIFMLEAIIPFVSDRMKAPLAMYIKIMELQTILSSLQDKECMARCGLHKDINNQDDILSSLADCGFEDIKGKFANLKKMLDVMKMMESAKEMPGGNFSGNGSMFSDLFGGFAGSGSSEASKSSEVAESSEASESSEVSGSSEVAESSEVAGSPKMSKSAEAPDTSGLSASAWAYKNPEFPEDNTDSLYQHYGSVSAYEAARSPQSEKKTHTGRSAQDEQSNQATHFSHDYQDAHTTDDLYGSIKDLFDAYDKDHR